MLDKVFKYEYLNLRNWGKVSQTKLNIQLDIQIVKWKLFQYCQGQIFTMVHYNMIQNNEPGGFVVLPG